MSGSGGSRNWSLGANHTPTQWQNKLLKRGWTWDQIDEAIRLGTQYPAVNNIDPSRGATRFVHPLTGRSVVLDDVTDEVIHVGGDGFVY